MTVIGQFQALVGKIGVWYLQQRRLGTLLEAHGLILDGAADAMLSGMRRGQPYRCPVDAFPALSKDRKVGIYASEPESSIRWRLAHWRQLRRTWGCHYGEMLNVQPYFLPGALPNMMVVHQDGAGTTATWHTLSSAGVYDYTQKNPSNFNFDGATSKWSRFWVFLEMPPALSVATAYNDGHVFNGGQLYDGTFTAAQYADLVAMVQEVKAAHSVLWGFIVVPNGGLPNAAGTPVQDASGWWSLPAGHWGSTVDPGDGRRTRPPTYTWIYDLGQG